MSEPLSERDLRALVDRLLLEQGRLDPLELLLAGDLLAYADYEAWRMGRRQDIQEALRVAPAQAAEVLEQAAAYARRQRLVASPLAYVGWGASEGPLHIGDDAGLVRACAFAYAPPADRPQLDLFHDSSGLLLEKEIACALAERRVDQARALVARLMRQDPRHRHAPGFLHLIQVVDDAARTAPEERMRELEAIEPLTRGLLGHRERDFLAPLWTSAAEAVMGRPFDPGSPRRHASFAWAKAGRWDAVCAAVEAESGWREQPLLVLAHAEARWRLRDAARARRDWLDLCWTHPREADRAIGAKTFPDRRLAELWGAFADLDEALETGDFPAWLLLEEPGMAAAVPPEMAPSNEQGTAYHLLHRLVSGSDDIALRRQLAELRPELFRQFLARR